MCVNCDLGGSCWCKFVLLLTKLFKLAFCMLWALANTNWLRVVWFNRCCWWPKLMNGFGGIRGGLVSWTTAIGRFFFSWKLAVCGIPSGSVRNICRCGGGGGIFRCCVGLICGLMSKRGFINGVVGMPFIRSSELCQVKWFWLNLGIVLQAKNFGAVCCRKGEFVLKMFCCSREFHELTINCLNSSSFDSSSLMCKCLRRNAKDFH